jgi:hypothetical protein
LKKAHFEEFSRERLEEAFKNNPVYGVYVKVDFDKYLYIKLFYKGNAIKTIKKRDWKQLYWKERELQVDVFKRIFMISEILPAQVPKNYGRGFYYHK